MEIRLQKYLARSGVASRRCAEELIKNGKVKVNGTVVKQMGVKVRFGIDKIYVNGAEVNSEVEKVYVMLNKPKGYVTTVSDDRNRKTVVDLVKGVRQRIYPVGRLDYDTEGMLIMTNDGDLAYRLTHPKFGIKKTYSALVRGFISDSDVRKLRSGIVIDDKMTSPAVVTVVTRTKFSTKIQITCIEGRNRQVRRMLEALGYTVKKLKRIKEASLTLGTLPVGQWRLLASTEIRQLKKSSMSD